MGIFSTVKAFFTGAKVAEGSMEIAQKATDGVIAGIDALVLTEEERIQYNQQSVGQLLKFWDVAAKENSEQSRARRDLAKMTFQVFFSMLLMAIGVWPFAAKYATFILGIAGEITFIVSAITLIYFGPHQISKIWSKKDK